MALIEEERAAAADGDPLAWTLLLSVIAHLGLLGAMAAARGEPDDALERDHEVARQRYLVAAVAREQELLEELEPETPSPSGGSVHSILGQPPTRESSQGGGSGSAPSTWDSELGPELRIRSLLRRAARSGVVALLYAQEVEVAPGRGSWARPSLWSMGEAPRYPGMGWEWQQGGNPPLLEWADLDPPAAPAPGLGLALDRSGQPAGPGRASPELRPRVLFDAPFVRGRLSPEAIRPGLSANHGRMQACYRRALSMNPQLGGWLRLRFVIDRTGAVTDAYSMGADVADSSLVRCVRDALAGADFPAPEGGLAKVDLPISFVPSSAVGRPGGARRARP